MNIKIILDKRSTKKDGRYPVKFRFTSGTKSVYVATNMFAYPEEFDESLSLFITRNKSTKENFRRNNTILINEREYAEQLIYDLERKNQGNISPAKFKELFTRKYSSDDSFTKYFKEFIETKEGRTKEIYAVTLKKISRFTNCNLYFDDIDYGWLVKFELYLKNIGNSINTIAIDMRNIRSIYRSANKNKVVSKDLYPFDDYSIKREETEHRAITVEKLREIFNFNGTQSENWARDVAKLMFLLIGINATDLYDITKQVDGRLNYRRDKTGRLYSIKLEKEAVELIQKFKGKETFLCFKEQFKTKADFLKKINGETIYINREKKYLKRGLNSIGDAIGVDGLTTYVMRHTWGTLAGELDIPKETIAKCLGHGKKTVTDIYVKFDNKKIDEANRNVINYVFEIN